MDQQNRGHRGRAGRQAKPVTRPQAPERADEWIVVAEARKAADAKRAALERLAAMGLDLYPNPGRHSFGVIGIPDDHIRIDLLCGRQQFDSWIRISVRKSALDAAIPEDAPTEPT